MEIIIFVIFVVIIIGLVIYIKTRPEKTIIKESPFARGEVLLKIKGAFMDKQETYYYEFMQRHLEQDKIIVPKVGIDNLLAPSGNKKQYEAICSKYVDFVIFDKKTMLPIVAIDLVEEKMSSKLTYFDKDVEEALKLVKIPIYTQYVEDFYVYEDLLEQMQKKIPVLNKNQVNQQEQKVEEETSSEVEKGEQKENGTDKKE
ncbi:MAG: DUF2726 domain-containing protein [Clostridia bacterium]|nr:DUF2726 domain-containing protein [Clostridia bacterium]